MIKHNFHISYYVAYFFILCCLFFSSDTYILFLHTYIHKYIHTYNIHTYDDDVLSFLCTLTHSITLAIPHIAINIA